MSNEDVFRKYFEELKAKYVKHFDINKINTLLETDSWNPIFDDMSKPEAIYQIYKMYNTHVEKDLIKKDVFELCQKYEYSREDFNRLDISRLLRNSTTVSYFLMQNEDDIKRILNQLKDIRGSREDDAILLQKKLYSAVFDELDTLLSKNEQMQNQEEEENKNKYIEKFISIDDIFFPYYASFDKLKINILEKGQRFETYIKHATTHYLNLHTAYIQKTENDFNDLINEQSDDNYLSIKRLTVKVNKMITKQSVNITRFKIIKNVYTDEEKKNIIDKLQQNITKLQEFLKRLKQKELHLKEKEDFFQALKYPFLSMASTQITKINATQSKNPQGGDEDPKEALSGDQP
jgi:hypothetical protein